jgi:hypothetical protein
MDSDHRNGMVVLPALPCALPKQLLSSRKQSGNIMPWVHVGTCIGFNHEMLIRVSFIFLILSDNKEKSPDNIIIPS